VCWLNDFILSYYNTSGWITTNYWLNVSCPNPGKIKVKCILVQALRLCKGRAAHRGRRSIDLLFHDHGPRRGWGVSVTPRLLFTPGKDPDPLYRKLGGPQGRSGQVRKISPPSGFDPRTFQPVTSCYIDYATRSTNPGKIKKFFSPPKRPDRPGAHPAYYSMCAELSWK